MADHPHLDLAEFLPYLLNRVGSALVARFSESALAGTHLSIATWRVLAALSNNGPLRQIDIAEITSMDVSTMSRLVTRLVQMGLVSRTRSSTSNREVVVELTPKELHTRRTPDSDCRRPAGNSDARTIKAGSGCGQTSAAPDARKSRARRRCRTQSSANWSEQKSAWSLSSHPRAALPSSSTPAGCLPPARCRPISGSPRLHRRAILADCWLRALSPQRAAHP